MTDILAKIAAYKRLEIAESRELLPLSALESKITAQTPPRGFLTALREKAARGGVGLIAEIKKASPSRGLIRADFDPPVLAQAYERGGADCLSVLTDTPSFQGQLDYLVQARAVTRLPILRKDFMLDPYQVAEARAYGADCILIVLACVSDPEARALTDAARSYGMDILVEAHDAEEMHRAIALKTGLIGINNRDLRDFSLTLETTARLAELAPKDVLLVSESGILRHKDVLQVKTYGASACLVGESLMLQADVADAARRLMHGE